MPLELPHQDEILGEELTERLEQHLLEEQVGVAVLDIGVPSKSTSREAV